MRKRIAWKRIWVISTALAVVLLLALACSLRPWQNRSVGAAAVNLGTAQMQAEVMALAIRFPLVPPPPKPIPMVMKDPMARSALQLPAQSTVQDVATVPVLDSNAAAAVDRWRPQFQPRLTDPVDERMVVIEWTLPYCWPGNRMQVCQDNDDLVTWTDDRHMYALRRQLVAQLPLANRRSVRVPDAALVGTPHMSLEHLQLIQKQGNDGCRDGDRYGGHLIVHLSMPVFSTDNQWAMIAVANGYCASEGGYRARILFHREDGRWVLERTELALWGIRQGHAPWPKHRQF